MPRLTCVTTTFNEGPVLLTSVRSILSQSFADFQLIIVDDGSSDNTRAVLATLDDPRILVIPQANDGLSGARNKGLEQATGDYICFLDADDTRPTWAFEAIARALDAHEPDVLLCPGVLQELRGEVLPFYDHRIFDEIGRICPARVTHRGEDDFSRLRALAQRLEPQSANKVVSRTFLKHCMVGFPNTHFFEDIYFHTNIIAAANRIAFLNTPAFTYYRRYLKPQITATAGDLRFDAIAVSKLTLEAFARRPEIDDVALRTAVIASCLKIIGWCEVSISYHQRAAFHEAARIMLAMADPRYLDLPHGLPDDGVGLTRLEPYLARLTEGVA